MDSYSNKITKIKCTIDEIRDDIEKMKQKNEHTINTMMNSIIPSSSIQNQDHMYYNSEEPDVNNYEMYLHKKNIIDENTLVTIPDDKKEELYKKYETFDSQGESYEINQMQNLNPITFGNNANKEMNEIESLQTIEDNNKLRKYKQNNNEIANEYLSEENNIEIINNKQNIINESPKFEIEEEVSQIEHSNTNKKNMDQRDLNKYQEFNQNKKNQMNNIKFNEFENDEQNDYIQDENEIENNLNNPSTNQVGPDLPMIKNKVKKILYNNKINDSNLDSNQLNNNNANTNNFSYNISLERNVSPIINQYSENEFQSHQIISSKDPELQLEISQLKSQITSLQSKYDLLTRELQAEKAKNEFLQIKAEQQNEKFKEMENDTLKKITECLNVQQYEDILPKLNEMVSKMNQLPYEINKHEDREFLQTNQNIPEKLQKEENLQYTNINDKALRDELVSKLKTLYIALAGNEDMKDVDIKTVWRWIKHLIYTVKDLAQEKEKNSQLILEFQDAYVFRDFCLDIMQELNLNDLNELKQFIYSNLQMQDDQQIDQNMNTLEQKGNSGGYTYQRHQENIDDNYQMNINRENSNNMNSEDYQYTEDDNH